MITLENGDEVNITHVTVLGGSEDKFIVTKIPEEPTMSIRFLKIKLKTLAAEARIIRREELKIRNHWRVQLLDIPVEVPAEANAEREQLYLHRILVVRKVARDTLIAYGYLRGRSYERMEPKPKRGRQTWPDWKAVETMIKKYGTPEQLKAFPAWKDVAMGIDHCTECAA